MGIIKSHIMAFEIDNLSVFFCLSPEKLMPFGEGRQAHKKSDQDAGQNVKWRFHRLIFRVECSTKASGGEREQDLWCYIPFGRGDELLLG